MSPQVIILFLEPEKTRIPVNFCPGPETRIPANLLPGPESGPKGDRTRPRGGPNTELGGGDPKIPARTFIYSARR